MKQIGENLRTQTNSVELAHAPIDGTVSVVFTPAQAITWNVVGNKVVFSQPVEPGTRIDVTYEY